MVLDRASRGGSRWLDGGSGMLVEPLVRAVVVEMAHALVEDGAGVSLVGDQDSVGALGAHVADEPFDVAVRPRSLARDFNYVDAFGSEDGIEGVGELGVLVLDQEAARGDLPPRSISRLRAAWAVQVAVGWAVTPRIWIRFRAGSLTRYLSCQPHCPW